MVNRNGPPTEGIILYATAADGTLVALKADADTGSMLGRQTVIAETPRGYSQITSLSSAATIGSVPASSTKAVIQVYGQPVRWRDDGTNPTTTVGMLMQPGDTLIYDGTLSAIKFIELAASAKLDVSFY